MPQGKYPTQWGASLPGLLSQFQYFEFLFSKIKKVDGDVVECGLGIGGSFSMLAYLCATEGREPARTLRGFDSFLGWPEPDTVDMSWRNPKKGEWAIPRAELEERLVESGTLARFPALSVVITPGWLADTLPNEKGYNIALAHLDVDLYPSYRDALEGIYPLVADGGIIAFDEYKEFSSRFPMAEKWPGCTKAVDEYLEPLGKKIEYYAPTKKYFVVK